MAIPEEVDEHLSNDVRAECSKHGPVSLCLVHVVENTLCPEDERVRIFVEFERQDSAIRAQRDLNGRYFAGRLVEATYYDEYKFQNRDLAPTVI